MATYFVTVELLGDPAGEVFAALDSLMQQAGFLGSVTASDGAVCDLPGMMFAGESALEAEALSLQISQTLRGSLWADTMVFVMVAGEWGVQYP